MSAKYKRRSLDEVLCENEYLLILAYVIYLFFTAIILVLRILKERVLLALK